MLNPILQNLNNGGMLSKINAIASMMNGKDPNVLYNLMMQTNPQFASFVKANEGKTPEQIARDNGIDPSIFNLVK